MAEPVPTLLGVPKARWRVALTVLLAAFFLLVPVYAWQAGDSYVLILIGRILVFALAGVGLNLAMGYGGMVSFGHAMYMGVGAYVVAIASHHGLDSGLAHLLLVFVLTVLIAVPVGLVALRTQGIAFIMITLAFAQMFYFLGVSLKNYGGDDGMRLQAASALAPFDLGSATQRYWLSFAVLLAVLYGSWRLVHARFGYTLRGIKANERRMKALGYHTLAHKLAIYVVAAGITAVAGFLLANMTLYASPSYTAWTVSGELIVIVILGGVGTVVGPVVGALVFLLLEEWLSSLTPHWMAPLGIAIVLVVLLLRKGVYGSFQDWSRQREGGKGSAE